MSIFLVQAFTNSWDAPSDAQDRDEKWALLYSWSASARCLPFFAEFKWKNEPC